MLLLPLYSSPNCLLTPVLSPSIFSSQSFSSHSEEKRAREKMSVPFSDSHCGGMEQEKLCVRHLQLLCWGGSLSPGHVHPIGKWNYLENRLKTALHNICYQKTTLIPSSFFPKLDGCSWGQCSGTRVMFCYLGSPSGLGILAYKIKGIGLGVCPRSQTFHGSL
jgi:hypothetical protein